MYIDLKHLKVDGENFEKTPRSGRQCIKLAPIRPLHGTATAPYHGDALLAEGYSGAEVKET